MSEDKMESSVVLDTLLATSMILEFIESFQRRGVKIDLTQLGPMLLERKEARHQKLKDLGLVD